MLTCLSLSKSRACAIYLHLHVIEEMGKWRVHRGLLLLTVSLSFLQILLFIFNQNMKKKVLAF